MHALASDSRLIPFILTTAPVCVSCLSALLPFGVKGPVGASRLSARPRHTRLRSANASRRSATTRRWSNEGMQGAWNPWSGDDVLEFLDQSCHRQEPYRLHRR